MFAQKLKHLSLLKGHKKPIRNKHVEIKTSSKHPGKIFLLLSGTAISFYYLRKYYIKNTLQNATTELEDLQEELTFKQEVDEGFLAKTYTFMKVSWRFLEICFCFTPLVLTYPFTLLSNRFTQFWYRIFLNTLRFLGPTFIKLGQWMATRSDLFDKDLCLTLADLHTYGSIHSFEETKQIIEENYGRKMEDIFSEFSRVPIASGAIAQVYKAKIKTNDENDGKYVAVKIKHPNIEKKISLDLKLISFFAKGLNLFESLKWLNIEGHVKVFSKNMLEQLNMKKEGLNLLVFQKNFKDIPNIIFPTPLMDFTNDNILVETFENGIKMTDIVNSKEYSKDTLDQIAKFGVVLYLKMIVDNFLHGDLHPGNLFVNFDKFGNPYIVVLDVGLVSKLKPQERDNLINLFTSISLGLGYEAAELMIDNASKSEVGEIAKEKIEGFRRELGEFFQFLFRDDTEEVELAKTFSHILELGKKWKVKIDSSLATVIIGTIVIEGLGRQLSPELDFMSESKPALSQAKDMRNAYFKKRFNKFMENGENKFSSYMDNLKDRLEELLK